jgi:hypothetical protein
MQALVLGWYQAQADNPRLPRPETAWPAGRHHSRRPEAGLLGGSRGSSVPRRPGRPGRPGGLHGWVRGRPSEGTAPRQPTGDPRQMLYLPACTRPDRAQSLSTCVLADACLRRRRGPRVGPLDDMAGSLNVADGLASGPLPAGPA